MTAQHTPGDGASAPDPAQLLATIDDVLATSTAPAIPAPADDPSPAPKQKPDWWERVYADQDADLDTHTGTPATLPDRVSVDKVDDEQTQDQDDEGDDQDDEDEEDQDDTPKKTKKQRKAEKKAAEAAALAPTAPPAGKSEATFLNKRGRQVIFAGTAHGLGWGTGLYHLATQIMDGAAQYATPVAGVSLGAGVLGLYSGSKFGGVVFAGSLGLIAVLQMADPARVVGGGIALGLQIAYRMFRRWVGPYGDKWLWKGVVWAAHVPAATATVAFLLYGTN